MEEGLVYRLEDGFRVLHGYELLIFVEVFFLSLCSPEFFPPVPEISKFIVTLTTSKDMQNSEEKDDIYVDWSVFTAGLSDQSATKLARYFNKFGKLERRFLGRRENWTHVQP